MIGIVSGGVALLGVAGAAASIGGAMAIDRYGRRPVPREDFDAIVVAGCKVYSDGRASPALQRRTHRAVDLFDAGWAPRLVFTGAMWGGGSLSEAEAAARIARDRGVPDHAIVLEEQSVDTRGNAEHTARLLGGGRIVVVSDSYHVLRCERYFVQTGAFERVVGVGAPAPRALRPALRELAVLLLPRLGRRQVLPSKRS